MRNYVMKIKAAFVKPGMISEDWDLAGLMVEEVKMVRRPKMRFDLVKILFDNGETLAVTTETTLNMRRVI
jgi:hypothetical protein